MRLGNDWTRINIYKCKWHEKDFGPTLLSYLLLIIIIISVINITWAVHSTCTAHTHCCCCCCRDRNSCIVFFFLHLSIGGGGIVSPLLVHFSKQLIWYQSMCLIYRWKLERAEIHLICAWINILLWSVRHQSDFSLIILHECSTMNMKENSL